MDANRKSEIPRTTMERLPGYLNFLKSWECPDGRVSSAVIAREMGLSAITVRKDLAYIASGRPRVGHLREELIERIARALGSGACRAAVVVGVGNLGHALMCYKGFAPYGMRVAAGFDVDARIVGGEVDGKPVYPMEALPAFVRRTGTRIGILAVPASGAQEACERMAGRGHSRHPEFCARAPARATGRARAARRLRRLAGAARRRRRGFEARTQFCPAWRRRAAELKLPPGAVE